MFSKFNFAEMVLTGISRSITVNPQNCTRMKHKHSDCVYCHANCPVNAIEVGAVFTTIKVDWDKCIGCGICVNLCPNQVFTLKNSGYKQFLNICCKYISEDGQLTLSCGETEFIKDKDIGIECIGILNTVDLLALYLNGAKVIKVKYSNCVSCLSKYGKGVFEKQLYDLEMVSHLFKETEDIDIEINDNEAIINFPIQKPIQRPIEIKPNPNIDRRGLFSFYKNSIKETALKSASMISIEKLEPRTIIRFDKIITARRQLFLDILVNMGSLAKVEAPVGRFFYNIKINENCIFCGMCVKFCSTGALSINEEKTRITFNPSKCNSCMLCKVTCFHNMLSVEDTLELKYLFTDIILVEKNSKNTTTD